MPRWLRIIRGMMGTGLIFAAGVFAISTAIALPMWLILGADAGRELAFLVVASSIWAFPIGMVFAGIMAVTARGRPLEELSLPRFAALGVGAGLLLFGVLGAKAWQDWSVADALGNAAIFAFLGGGSAAATLGVARRAASALAYGHERRTLQRLDGVSMSERPWDRRHGDSQEPEADT